MMYTIVLIQFTGFIASYVNCARQPPTDFSDKYDEEKCIKLNHAISHVTHLQRSAMSLDMICEADHQYDLISFATPQPIVVHAEKDSTTLTKVDHNITVLNFIGMHRDGVATLYFESVEDAKNFNRDVYPLLKKKLEHIQRIGTIKRILTTHLSTYSLATQFADIYYERESEPTKFVVEADNIPEPVLVFTKGDFNLRIDTLEHVYQTLLKLGGATIYVMSFDNAQERRKLTDKVGELIGSETLRIA